MHKNLQKVFKYTAHLKLAEPHTKLMNHEHSAIATWS